MSENTGQVNNDLQRHLQANKNIENVYFNEKGQWQFHPRHGYDEKLTRDQILNMKVSDQKDVAPKVALSTTPGVLTDKAIKKGKDVEPEDKKDMTTKEPEVINPTENVNIETDPSQEKQADAVQESFQKPSKSTSKN